MSQPSYQQKVTVQLSVYANLFSPGADQEEALYQAILAQLLKNETALGKWEIVWGPALVQFDSDFYPANAIYLARSADPPYRYVMAMAGTNPCSLFDWAVEDFLVACQVPWPFAASSGAAIAAGTAIGLLILLDARPGGTRPGAGTTLTAFLAGLPDKNVELTVTGHSLGGALSATLALWLEEIRLLWDPLGQTTLLCLPSAGPTAGNTAFANYSDSRLQADRFANSLDVVPHAWNEATLQEIGSLYAPDIPADPLINLLVGMAMKAAAKGAYSQIEPQAPPIPGTVNTGIIDPTKPNLENFLAQVLYQHIDAYLGYFEIPGVETPPIGTCGERGAIAPAFLQLARRAHLPLPAAAGYLAVPDGTLTAPLGGRLVEIPQSYDAPNVTAVRNEIEQGLAAAAKG